MLAEANPYGPRVLFDNKCRAACPPMSCRCGRAYQWVDAPDPLFIGVQKLRNRHPKSNGEFFDVVQGNVAGATFYVGDKGAMKARFVSQVFLRKPTLCSQTNHVASKQLASSGNSSWLGWQEL